MGLQAHRRHRPRKVRPLQLLRELCLPCRPSRMCACRFGSHGHIVSDVSARPSGPTCSCGSAVLLKLCSLCQSSCGEPEAECFRLHRHQRVQQATCVAPQRHRFTSDCHYPGHKYQPQCWQEERQQRADHLRRQRDRLIEKRAKVGLR